LLIAYDKLFSGLNSAGFPVDIARKFTYLLTYSTQLSTDYWLPKSNAGRKYPADSCPFNNDNTGQITWSNVITSKISK